MSAHVMARIDLGALAHNVRVLKARTDGRKLMVVVKADAYGHGLVKCGQAAVNAGADYLGVALLEEAVARREGNVPGPILAWLNTPNDRFAECIARDIDLGINSVATLKGISNAAYSVDRIARVHVKVDTGLNRNGVTLADLPELILALSKAEAEGTKEKELAIATGIEARGTAEATSIHLKADAMKLLHAAGQEHEEFKLRLAKERDVEMAAINVQRDVAQANASVVSEALKTAKIDIVGGENDFFEKIVRSIGTGKSVDRMVQNSATLTDIKETFFNGDPERFKSQLRKWVSDFGIGTADLKNLTLSALLVRLAASADDAGVKATIRSALALVKEKGMGEVRAETVVKQD